MTTGHRPSGIASYGLSGPSVSQSLGERDYRSEGGSRERFTGGVDSVRLRPQCLSHCLRVLRGDSQ
jgi:hypothetical protein